MAAVVVGALVVVGGGGTGIFLSQRDTSPSKVEFIAKADQICRPANGPVSAIVRPTNYPELATATSTFVTTTQGQLGQLRSLDRPSGVDGNGAMAALAALDGSIASVKSLNGAASRGDDRETISTTNNARSAFTTASTQASGFGFGACTVGLQSGIDSITGGAQAVIKTGFVAKAESACMAASRQFDEIIEPSGPREVRSYFDKVEAVFTKLVSDIKALAVAPGDEPTVSEMVGALERTNAKGAELFDAIAGNDQARAAALNRELSTLNTAANAKLDGYGLGQCGSNFGAV